MMVTRPDLCNNDRTFGLPATEALEKTNRIDDVSLSLLENLADESIQTGIAIIDSDLFPRLEWSCCLDKEHDQDDLRLSEIAQRTERLRLKFNKRKNCTGLLRSMSLPCLSSTLETTMSAKGGLRASTGGLPTKKPRLALAEPRLAPLACSTKHSSTCSMIHRMCAKRCADSWRPKYVAPATKLGCPFPHCP
ncbi:expressed unknown protein [Seminavis robusta]|uniref:Uncharacterized protein n=1 Tax=Seminavis robusta TaxID=568900 RepID=A0A9N8HFK0_9STRA|nr:expressed unknown protein [Seminavis robusta]|eukprot:Sro438_g143101.1  (192) ;mRNA; r:49758-50333